MATWRAGMLLACLLIAASCARTAIAIDCALKDDAYKTESCKERHRAARRAHDERNRNAARCDRGVAAACYDVARYDEPNHADPGSSLRRYERACTGGIIDACFRAAGYWEDGRGVRADPLRASQLSEHACGKGHGVACVRVADLRASNAERVPWDQRACALEQWPSCLRAGQALLAGDGIPAEPARARELFVLACGKGQHRQSCVALGQLDVASAP